MVYKWCIVPQCANTSIKTPHKLFVSVPTNPKRRNKWLQLARRNPTSILSHTNVFMCEDHFDMEKDTINYMKYRMGFCSKIILTEEAVPSKFNCQEDRKRRLGDPNHQSAVIATRKRMELLKVEKGSYVQSQDMTETVRKDENILQEPINRDEETPKTQDRETRNDPIIMVDKSIQGTVRANVHCRSKFMFACVQCNVRACCSCDALGEHAQHYVLRVPEGRPVKEFELVIETVRKAISRARVSLIPTRPGRNIDCPPAENAAVTEDEEAILKTELNMEFESEEHDPLASMNLQMYENPAKIATAGSGPQIVPTKIEVKQEPPDDDSEPSDTTSKTPEPSSSYRQSMAAFEDDDTLPSDDIRNIDQTSELSFGTLNTLKRPAKRKADSQPNSEPGSPTTASSLVRLKQDEMLLRK